MEKEHEREVEKLREELEEELDKVREEYKVKETSIKKSGEMKQMEDERKLLQKQIKEEKSKLDGVKKEKKTIDKEVASLQKEKEEHELKINEYLETIQMQEERLGQLREELTELQEAMEQKQAKTEVADVAIQAELIVQDALPERGNQNTVESEIPVDEEASKTLTESQLENGEVHPEELHLNEYEVAEDNLPEKREKKLVSHDQRKSKKRRHRKAQEEENTESEDEVHHDDRHHRHRHQSSGSSRGSRSSRHRHPEHHVHCPTCHRNVPEVESDQDSYSDSYVIPKHRKSHRRTFGSIYDHLSQEKNAITLAKEFLRKQKHSLRARQAALKAAKQEWNSDLGRVRFQDHSQRPPVLSEVRAKLDREARELDSLAPHIATGNRLLKEKERTLKDLEESLALDESSNSDSPTFPVFSHKRRSQLQPRVSDLQLSDSSESSGISSNEMNLDELLPERGVHPPPKPYFSSPGPPPYVPPQSILKPPTSPIGETLSNINKELGQVLGVLKAQSELRRSPTASNSVGTQMQGIVPQSSIETQTSVPRPQSSYTQTIPSSPYAPPPDIRYTTEPRHAWGPANPYITEPYHRANFSSGGETVQQMLEKKWRKYFGDQKGPLRVGAGTTPSSSLSFGYVPASEQLASFRSSTRPAPDKSVEDSLAQHRQWLRDYHRDVGLKPPPPGPSLAYSSIPTSSNSLFASGSNSGLH